MVSVLVSTAVGCGLEPMSSQIKDYKIGIRYSSTKHSALISKSKDWLWPRIRIMCPRGTTCQPTDCCYK